MRKAILKRLGSFTFVVAILVLSGLTLFVPAYAEDISQVYPAQIFTQYESLKIRDKDLFSGLNDWINEYRSGLERPYLFDAVDLTFGDLSIVSMSFSYAEGGLTVELESGRYYVLKNNADSRASAMDAYLKDENGNEYGQVLFRHDSDLSYVPGYGFVFNTDEEYRFLSVSCWNGITCSLYEVTGFDVTYDVSKTSFAEDMTHLFGGEINSTLDQYCRSEKQSVNYIKILAIYDDPETIGQTVNRSPYVYFYDSTGKADAITDLKFVDRNGNIVQLTRIQGKYPTNADRDFENNRFGGNALAVKRWFGKFRASGWNAFVSGITETFTLDQIRVTYYGDPVAKVYSDLDFDLSVEKASDGTVSFRIAGSDAIYININYTCYRTDTSATYGAYHHNQIDSIYFTVPDSLKQYGKLTNVSMTYRRARTQPIVVATAGTDAGEWFVNFARNGEALPEYSNNPFNPHRDDSAPVFWSEDMYVRQSTNARPKYTFNTTWHGYGEYDSPSIYWAFTVGDPTVTSTSINRDNNDSVVYDADLKNWMYSYVGHGETVSGANGEIACELFSEIDPEYKVLDTNHFYGNALNSDQMSTWQKWATFGFWTVVGGNLTTEESIRINPENNVVMITDRNQLDPATLWFDARDYGKMLNVFNHAVDETMYLVRFAVSDYYSTPIDISWKHEKNGKTITENSSGYIAIEDVYLDLHLLQLDFTSDTGVVTTQKVTSNHIDGIGTVITQKTPSIIEQESKEKVLNQLGNTFDSLKKMLAVILIVVIVLVVVVIVSKVVGIFKSNKVVIRDNPQDRSRQRWRRRRR